MASTSPSDILYAAIESQISVPGIFSYTSSYAVSREPCAAPSHVNNFTHLSLARNPIPLAVAAVGAGVGLLSGGRAASCAGCSEHCALKPPSATFFARCSLLTCGPSFSLENPIPRGRLFGQEDTPACYAKKQLNAEPSGRWSVHDIHAHFHSFLNTTVLIGLQSSGHFRSTLGRHRPDNRATHATSGGTLARKELLSTLTEARGTSREAGSCLHETASALRWLGISPISETHGFRATRRCASLLVP